MDSEGKKPSLTQIKVESAIPKIRQEKLKWNGWGYKDAGFFISDNLEDTHFEGDGYPLDGEYLPTFMRYAEERLGIDKNAGLVKPVALPSEDQYPISKASEELKKDLTDRKISFSVRGEDRLIRSHGHTLREIYALRNGQIKRIPDIVVWPECHQNVVDLVKLADERNVVIIPFGGGTSVTLAVECPEHEQRPILSLDTSQMNKILWIDRENLVARFESGIIGQDLEREMNKLGYTVGHEPDSLEFSSLGGWVATRASGMKKSVYGNIEDLIVHFTAVTPKGVVSKSCSVPRISSGPDLHQFFLGSEGTLGVITEVTLKIRPLPAVKKFGSLAFPSIEAGVNCLREIAAKKIFPASIRLMDNNQFVFAHAIKPQMGSLKKMMDSLKKTYLAYFKGFDLSEMAVATLLFEGECPETVKLQERKVLEIAAKHGGLPGGEENGKRGYLLTFVIAYIRDAGFDLGILAESFETSVPWDRVMIVYNNVIQRMKSECSKRGIKTPSLSCRVTQSYEAGAAMYFYFGFEYRSLNVEDPVGLYEEIEHNLRDEVMRCGGSISHHHGVGKLRKQFMERSVSKPGVELLRGLKKAVDPKNIFASGNLIDFNNPDTTDENHELMSKL
ncbi:unnamed protein product [Notodromas monacha]|uniref:Alkylglycerone-phosphate synthase n=1 Tax=Notodromas monacha TaxID=399045 RepID=A0A7R9BFP7_9CRUS|nr:unnamed protein product [Notodromas monacha]CAG0912989.1 unnamed protein product [Notodromas monacha]